MKFFLDTADVDEIRELNEYNLVDGVTTNPTLIKKSGRNVHDVLEEICNVVRGPVSAEVIATNHEDMVAEANTLRDIANNIVIKLPTTLDGIRACHDLRYTMYQTNLTLCFSVAQALMVAKVRATYVSPFVGRLDDIGEDGMKLVEDIITVYKAQNYKTQVLVASVRNPMHVIRAAKLGADAVTLPPSVMKQLIKHPLTDSGLETFLKDWEATGQSI